MKHVSTLDIKTDGDLKVKKHTLVITSYEARSNSKAKVKDEEQVSSNHITIREANDLEAKVEPVEVLKTLDDGGQATVDKLKEVNLRSKEDSCPIYVSTMLTAERKARL